MYNCLYCDIVVSILSKWIYFPIGWTWGSSRQAGGGRRLFGKQRVVGNIRNIERKFSRHTDWTVLVINLIHLVSADWFLCVSTDRPGTTVCRSDELLNWRWMCECWSDSTEWTIIRYCAWGTGRLSIASTFNHIWNISWILSCQCKSYYLLFLLPEKQGCDYFYSV